MATKKKAPAKKTAAKKSPAKKAPAKKVAKKAPAKKVASKKTVKKAPAKKAPAKKAATKKAPAKKVATKKAPAKKAVKKPAKKKAAKKVEAKKVVKKVAAPKPVKVKRPLVVEPVKPSLVVPKNTKTSQYTQSELLDSMTSFLGFEKRKVTKEFYDSFSEMIQVALKSGYKIVLPGLGKLQVKKTKARMGINPKTMEAIKISAKKKVAFTVGKALKEAVL